jgi:hypothetical protein
MGVVDIAIGIDIGQKRDPTAIAVTELVPNGSSDEIQYVVRHLERLPLGTSYPKIAERLAAIVQNARQTVFDRDARHRPQVPFSINTTTYVDATGVGKPVVDILREAGVPVTECYFTHGDRRTEKDGVITIGKAWLVSRLQALLQTQRVLLPASHPEAAALQRELLDYEIRISERANGRTTRMAHFQLDRMTIS